jgi:hypothetical protein
MHQSLQPRCSVHTQRLSPLKYETHVDTFRSQSAIKIVRHAMAIDRCRCPRITLSVAAYILQRPNPKRIRSCIRQQHSFCTSRLSTGHTPHSTIIRLSLREASLESHPLLYRIALLKTSPTPRQFQVRRKTRSR